jgi:cell division septum initiation protein DivIVA
MAGSVEELVKLLTDMVHDAFTLPLGADKCVLNRDRVLDILEEITATLPGDLKQARSIVESRNEILSQAKRESESIKRQAEDRARQLVSQQEILITARQKANDMLAAAKTEAREVRRAANEYVDGTLKSVEDAIGMALTEVRKKRTDFRAAAKVTTDKQ